MLLSSIAQCAARDDHRAADRESDRPVPEGSGRSARLVRQESNAGGGGRRTVENVARLLAPTRDHDASSGRGSTSAPSDCNIPTTASVISPATTTRPTYSRLAIDSSNRAAWRGALTGFRSRDSHPMPAHT